MASIKDLKKRITSVKNTQQTTKAMKMVSAAKLRRAQDAILNNRPYAKQIGSLVQRMLGAPEVKLTSPLFAAGATDHAGKKLLLVVVTSDRGLCGGFNSNIIRTTQRMINENRDGYASIKLAFMGKRGYDFFKTKKVELGPYFAEAGGKATFLKAKGVSHQLVKLFLDGEVDEIKFLFNEFKNAASQLIVLDRFLPLQSVSNPETTPAAKATPAQSSPSQADSALIKPGADEVLQALLDKIFVTQVFRVMLDSQAGEHGARMSAMENATKNAGEMIRKLTLQYNKQRQAGITKELLEIISGSESSKSA